MISSTGSIAASGLQAASKRLANSANNIANQQSTFSQVNGETVAEAFRPSDIVQISNEPTGGVRTELRERDPATVPVYDPTNGAADAEGITQYPNVNTEQELIDQKFASYDFKANLKSFKAEDENLRAVLDIIA